MKISDPAGLKGLKISSPDKAGAEPAAPAAPGKFNLEAGQIIKGRVAGFTPEGKVLLEVGGRTISARSEIALKAGSELWLEVRQGGDSPWLSLADRKGVAQEFLQELLPSAGQLAKALNALLGLASGKSGESGPGGGIEKILQQFASLAQGAEARPEEVIRLLSWMNTGAEGKAADLFGGRLSEQLRAAADFLGRNQELLPKSEIVGLQRLASLLDMHQQLNSLPSSSAQPLYLIFPCFFALGSGWGEWMFIREEARGKGVEDPRQTLSFFLEMSRLGELQIELRIEGKSLQGDLVVADQEVLDFLGRQIAELKDLLGKLGYGPVYFRLRIGQTGMLQELKAVLENVAQLKPVRIVDIKA